ncbi:leucine-rich repeat domain-containing protein [Tunicatimonas pelagia]|uniref:leucine-rich repeat domain-containing protein n=1 Tax=Tunicatimonas pelagia TaxID=931531 RepID=UPI002666D163|nr:hypothetical protein [Tunicatimonas pelagia]WKN44220.1 hypothetical protein P0M28_04465 [Tunicatimonas pelagia]
MNYLLIRLLILLGLGFFLRPFPVWADQVPDATERAALEALYRATQGDQWYDNTHWLSARPLGDWYGVTVRNGDVVALSLGFNDLVGELPIELYQLTALEELDLNDNYLRGTLDEAIGQLAQLQVLELSVNQLHGPLPQAIGQLRQLEILLLSVNNLEGEIPSSWRNLTQLRELDLISNLISGSVPAFLGQLTTLEGLWLRGNQFSGTVPAALGSLLNLTDLELGENLLEGPIPEAVLQLPSLEYVGLEFNQFSGTSPYFTSPFLRKLTFYDNQYHTLADYSIHPQASQLSMNVRNNALDFADVLPIIQAGQIRPTGFIHFPQDSLPTYFQAATYTYSVEVGGTGNQFQWLKNGQPVAGGTAAELVLSQATYRVEDTYQCEVTHPQAPFLTLMSQARPQVAGQYYAIADGRWSEAIWAREADGDPVDTFPQQGAEVFIIGHQVTVDEPLTTGSVHVIVDQAPASLVVDGAELTLHGTLELTKQTEGFPGHVKVINEGTIVPLAPNP